MIWPSLENHIKDHNRSRNFVFITLDTSPVIRGNPDLHFEGAGNGPVVITWIGREHQLYSGVSPISLVKHCVTFRHDRRLLSLLGFVHNWSATTKKTNQFSLNGNGIVSSFLGRQFYRSVLYLLITITHGVVANVLNCSILVIKFEHQSHYYFHFHTNNRHELHYPSLVMF